MFKLVRSTWLSLFLSAKHTSATSQESNVLTVTTMDTLFHHLRVAQRRSMNPTSNSKLSTTYSPAIVTVKTAELS